MDFFLSSPIEVDTLDSRHAPDVGLKTSRLLSLGESLEVTWEAIVQSIGHGNEAWKL